MDLKQLAISTLPTMETLLKATGNYVYLRIADKHEKAAYYQAMRQAILKVKHHSSEDAPDMFVASLRASIDLIRQDASSLYPKRLFVSRASELRGHNMAIDQALEVISSIEGRFITGQCDSAPRNYKYGGDVYDDQTVFGDI